MNTDRKQQTTDDEAQLPLRFRVAALVVPALVGFGLASSILLIMGPFESTIEQVAWLMIALIVSFATSTLVAEQVHRLIRQTDAYHRTHRFDSQVDELFGNYLRTGNIRSLRRSASDDGLDLKMIEAVASQLDELRAHDRMIRGHSERVRAYASLIGNKLTLSDHELELLNWTAMLHDIGKLDVPPTILNKPGKPTPDEWILLRGHPRAAVERLRPLEEYFGDSIYEGALYHHERWDGDGYPFGLSQGEIPLFARITAVADAFDVMTHARSYKSSMSITEARDELMSSAGSHFDPDIVTAFTRIGEEELSSVRGWSATLAGISLIGVHFGSVVSNTAIAAAVVMGASIVSIADADPPPAAVAFAVEAPAESSTTTLPPTSTTVVPTTTEVPGSTTAADSTFPTGPTGPTEVTTPSEVTTTTEPAVVEPNLISITYAIGTNEVDGIEAIVDADQLIVFVDEVQNSSHPLAPDQRLVPILFNIDELGEGNHLVRFELYDEGVLVSTDETLIFG